MCIRDSQKVTVEPAAPDDHYGDVVVDTGKSQQVYREWLALTRPAPGPDGTRRPFWLFRPYRPATDAYRVVGSGPPAKADSDPSTAGDSG